MHLRPLVLMGLALLAATGCQSYFPNGYGNTSPYPGVSGTYTTPPATTSPSRTTSPANLQPGSGQFPTPTGSRSNAPAGASRGQTSQGNVPDARFSEPGRIPSNLGSPAAGDDLGDPVRRGTSSNDGGKRVDEDSDDQGEALSSSDGEEFKSPTPYRQTSASSDDLGGRTPSSKPAPSPYKKDPNGYKWLRGVVTRDPKTNAWRITYSRNPLDHDPYAGSLTLVDDELFDTLMDDDVIYVEGTVDRSALDRYGKPSYRVARMTPPLHPKEE